MKFSEFCKSNKRSLAVIAAGLVVLTLGISGVSNNVKAISALRKAQEETPKEVVTKVETIVMEKHIVVERERVYFDVPLSNEVQDTIFDECEKRGISPAIIVAMIERESRFKVDVVGDKGRSFGLMQIQQRWHEQRMSDLGCDNLLDPVQNVKVGIDYLAELKERNGNIFWMLHGYNGGASYANRQAENGNVSEYAAGVVARAYELGGDLNAVDR